MADELLTWELETIKEMAAVGELDNNDDGAAPAAVRAAATLPACETTAALASAAATDCAACWPAWPTPVFTLTTTVELPGVAPTANAPSETAEAATPAACAVELTSALCTALNCNWLTLTPPNVRVQETATAPEVTTTPLADDAVNWLAAEFVAPVAAARGASPAARVLASAAAAACEGGAARPIEVVSVTPATEAPSP